MSVLTEEVKRIANSLDANYLRASNPADFNEAIRHLDLSIPLVSVINIPSIDLSVNELNTSAIENTTLEILFVKKNIDQDDTGEVVQEILDDLNVLIDNFYDALHVSTVLAKAVKTEGYSLTGGDSLQFSDERVSGWLMTVTVPTDKKLDNCG